MREEQQTSEHIYHTIPCSTLELCQQDSHHQLQTLTLDQSYEPKLSNRK